MTIKDFVKKAISQDKRNVFGEGKVKIWVPKDFEEFYTIANPISVEVMIDHNPVWFFPIEEIMDEQNNYGIGDNRFVFASCNGDPIYVMNNKIYTCCHGTKKITDELLAEDLFSFLSLID